MKGIKGIVLAGGLGTRLHPLTMVTNKHLLPIGTEPMIHYPVKKLVDAGITDIMIVTGAEHSGAMMTLLGSGRRYGCTFTYKVQDEPDGIAGALNLCRGFVGSSNCIVILGDNIFKDDLKEHVQSFLEKSKNCSLFLKKVDNPKRYGVAVFDGENLIEVEEKPNNPKTDLACVGIYLYSNKVFDIISNIKPSDRGEYEISSVNNAFIEGGDCDYYILKDLWVDAGTMDSYHRTNWIMYEENNGR
jgi:glucose-1-phosphate thymidylyltransferase